MQSENLNETFLKKTRKAKEKFQRQKEKEIQHRSDKKSRTVISIRTVYKRNKKERASHADQSAQGSLQKINKTVLPYLIFKKTNLIFHFQSGRLPDSS